MEWPIELETESISDLKSLNDFALYVPVMLALAIMMLMFTAAATLIKEKDKGTITRLRISNMTTFEWLSAVSLSQVIIGLLAVGTTYATAAALGYRSTGSLGAVIVVGIVSCLSLVALSLWVAAWLRTIFDLMTIGCFPFFVLMFFSGGMLPLPTWELLALGGRSVHVNDILPTTHSIAALGKILNHGAGLHEIGFEIAAIVFLSVLYFAGGIWLFTRRHMRAK
jgi:ABC-2 type transport system permease protein